LDASVDGFRVFRTCGGVGAWLFFVAARERADGEVLVHGPVAVRADLAADTAFGEDELADRASENRAGPGVDREVDASDSAIDRDALRELADELLALVAVGIVTVVASDLADQAVEQLRHGERLGRVRAREAAMRRRRNHRHHFRTDPIRAATGEVML